MSAALHLSDGCSAEILFGRLFRVSYMFVKVFTERWDFQKRKVTRDVVRR